MDDIPIILSFVICIAIAIVLLLVEKPRKPIDCKKLARKTNLLTS